MRLNLLVIRTAEIELLKNMYELIGFQFAYHQHGKGPFHYASDHDGVVFEIYPLMNPGDNCCENIRLGFEVENVTAVIEELRNTNWKILSEVTKTDWGEIAVVQDIDGRKIELKNK